MSSQIINDLIFRSGRLGDEAEITSAHAYADLGRPIAELAFEWEL